MPLTGDGERLSGFDIRCDLFHGKLHLRYGSADFHVIPISVSASSSSLLPQQASLGMGIGIVHCL